MLVLASAWLVTATSNYKRCSVKAFYCPHFDFAALGMFDRPRASLRYALGLSNSLGQQNQKRAVKCFLTWNNVYSYDVTFSSLFPLFSTENWEIKWLFISHWEIKLLYFPVQPFSRYLHSHTFLGKLPYIFGISISSQTKWGTTCMGFPNIGNFHF